MLQATSEVAMQHIATQPKLNLEMMDTSVGKGPKAWDHRLVRRTLW